MTGIDTIELEVAHPKRTDVQRLLEFYRYEHIGMYGHPDPNPAGDPQEPSASSVTLVVYVGTTAAATGSITLDGPNGDAVLRRMFTRWEFRRQGLAARMVDALTEAARSLGAERILLETGVQAVPALALYYSQGFAPVEPFGFYAEAEGSVFLGKDLR